LPDLGRGRRPSALRCAPNGPQLHTDRPLAVPGGEQVTDEDPLVLGEIPR